MLAKLVNVGRDRYQFSEIALNCIHKGCCDAIPEACCLVIDFDLVKDSLGADTPPKSCDAIKICIDDNRIDFIELKGFEKFKQYSPKQTTEDIQNQVAKFNFEKKIKDSYFVLDSIVSNQLFDDSDKTKLQNVAFHYFVVSDIVKDGLTNITASLNFLAEVSSIDKIIETTMKSQLNNLQISFLTEKPRLISCQRICEIICENNCCTPATSLNQVL